MKTIFSILIISLAVQNVFAQSTLVTGSLFDFETGQPMEDVVVLQYRTANGCVLDSTGNFSFYLDTNKNLNIDISFIEYFTIRIINLPAVETIKLDSLRLPKDYSAHIIVEMAPDIKPNKRKYRKLLEQIEAEYKLNIMGKLIKPVIQDHKIIFDYGNEP